MKKTILNFSLVAFLLLIGVTFFISCSKETDNNNPISFEAPKIQEYGKTVPVSLNIVDNTAVVGFMLSAQKFTIDLSEKGSNKTVDLIKKSIKEQAPVIVFLKENSNEIVKIEEGTQEDVDYFKKILVKPVSESSEENDKAPTVAVIPDQATLNSLFNTIKNESCGTTTAPSTCITFRYAVDGCYARAHRIRQILASNGYSCQKQFVYGSLKASTGSCCVSWVYHVAVLVKFVNAAGVTEERIIDPSLFSSGPVLATTWRNACKNSSCGSGASISSYANSAGSVYYRSPYGSVIYDNNYINTKCVLMTFKSLVGCSPKPAPSVNNCGY